jgi:hypothetical protein
MNGVSPAPPANVLQRFAEEFQPSFVEVIDVTVGACGMNQRRCRIDHKSKRIFGRNRSPRSLGRSGLHCCLIASFSADCGVRRIGSSLPQASEKISPLFAATLAVELAGLSCAILERPIRTRRLPNGRSCKSQDLSLQPLASRKNRLDLSVGIALGSDSQIALFVAPVLVLLSYVIGPAPMDLRFWPGAVVMMLIATLTASLVTNSGRSAWFGGVQEARMSACHIS